MPTPAPSTPPPASILQAFLASCQRTPDKTCLVFGDERLSYRQLLDAALRWAGALRARGLRPGDRIGLYLENSPAFLAAYLGIQFAGGIVVLVNTQYRQVELRHILSDSGTRLCVTDPQGAQWLDVVADDLPGLETVVVMKDERPRTKDEAAAGESGIRLSSSVLRPLSSTDLLADAAPLVPVLPDPAATALLAYTSGPTGRSKGAMLTHRNLAANCWAVTRAWRWTADDRLLLTLPLFHVHGLCVGFHGTLLVGGTADLRRRFDAADVYDTLLQGETTMFFGVPTMYTRLIAEAEKRSGQSGGPGGTGRPNGSGRPAPLRLYVSGSAPLNVTTFEAFERLFGQRILERYGMSETIMNLTNPYDGERRPGTVGGPFPGQEARIVDVQTRRPILDETPGEIQVRGPHVFKGYWQRPEATAEAFGREGWFNTGDLGWRSADGYYTISGRARELIITGGYNVYPREVEEVLLTHPTVAEVAVLGLPDPEFGEQVVAAVVPSPAAGAAPDPESLIALCRAQLASYKKPRRVVFVDSLPRNALGKVQKHLLREHLESMPRAS
jgi:malonyl-CoA/methylmalonyl-CoA synthetase